MEPDLVEIFGSYMSWKVTEDTWIINAMGGSQNMYLLEGGTHALLIDTLWGAGNLRRHVEGLTEKPVIVINTHGHLDHSGGNGEWEEVLMLEGAIPGALGHRLSRPQRRAHRRELCRRLCGSDRAYLRR